MLFANSLARDVAHLQKEAARVIKDVERIGEHLAKSGRVRTAEAVRELSDSAQGGLASMKEAVADVGRDVNVFIKKADATVRRKPYQALFGVLFVGILMGVVSALFPRRARS